MARRRKPRTYKKLYKLKVIEHKTVMVEADTEQAAIDSVVGSPDYVIGSARQLREKNERGQSRIIPSKVIKRTAKVIEEKDSADAIAARVKRQVAKELSQELCYTCGKTRAKEHSYDRVTEMYWGLDGHEYHSIKGMQRWFEYNKEWNQKRREEGFDSNLPTEFTKYELDHIKKLGISVA
jgi:hypothetical protein